MWNLGIQNYIKKKQKKTAEYSHGDLLCVYKSNFAQMPISRENMNGFCSDLCKLTIQDGRQGLLLKIA